jgi:hypothetical protein
MATESARNSESGASPARGREATTWLSLTCPSPDTVSFRHEAVSPRASAAARMRPAATWATIGPYKNPAITAAARTTTATRRRVVMLAGLSGRGRA